MAKVKEIDVGLGITIEINGTYYKPTTTIHIALDDADNTKEKIEQIFKTAWELAEKQIENEIDTLVK